MNFSFPKEIVRIYINRIYDEVIPPFLVNLNEFFQPATPNLNDCFLTTCGLQETKNNNEVRRRQKKEDAVKTKLNQEIL